MKYQILKIEEYGGSHFNIHVKLMNSGNYEYQVVKNPLFFHGLSLDVLYHFKRFSVQGWNFYKSCFSRANNMEGTRLEPSLKQLLSDIDDLGLDYDSHITIKANQAKVFLPSFYGSKKEIRDQYKTFISRHNEVFKIENADKLLKE